MSPEQYKAMADAVLALHFGIVVFVVLGLPLILAGGALHWRWVRNFWFRILHLAAIAYVASQTWFGIDCPLTTLEVALRARAGELSYEGSFIEYWLSRILFYRAPPWAFIVTYTAFALAVAYAWVWISPELPRRNKVVSNGSR